MGGDALMYRVEWLSDLYVGELQSCIVQYLPDISAVIRKAFGEDGATFVTITKED